MSRVLGTFEMLWDCGACGTKGLLGKTNRQCPNCGAPQVAELRYFPPPGMEKEAVNHTFDGTDKKCPSCFTPNGARSNNCRNCGTPLGEAAAVPLVSNTPAPPEVQPLPLQSPVSGRGCRLFLGVGGAIVVLVLLLMFWRKDVTVTVAGHRWEREIAIETLGPRSESVWCSELPGDAYGVRRSREQRSTERIADGQECGVRNRDNGDGTFSQVEECHTRYREEPVYADKCYYTVDRWQQSGSERAAGASLSPSPAWPAVQLARSGTCRGCQREGPRRERYAVSLQSPDNQPFECEVSAVLWQQFALGSRHPMTVRAVGNRPVCSSLRPN